MFEHRKKIEELKRVKEAQKAYLDNKYDCGFYNGLELAISSFEGRDPEYVFIEEKKEEKPNGGRTIASGKRVKGD